MAVVKGDTRSLDNGSYGLDTFRGQCKSSYYL